MKLHGLLVVVVCFAVCGCDKAPTVPQPTGQLVFQPRFQFADGETTHQGTGFVVATADGQRVGVTSAHFLDFEGAPMVSAEWLAVPDDSEVFQFTHSLGAPGDGGQVGPDVFDLRRDYFIIVGDEPATVDCQPLELDDRPRPKVGERVWLPNKDADAPEGYEMVAGFVDEVADEYIGIELDDEIQLQSQSGSPIISQRTGKVLGTLARGGSDGGKTFLRLCPAKGILEVIAANPPTMKLEQAVGDLSLARDSSRTTPAERPVVQLTSAAAEELARRMEDLPPAHLRFSIDGDDIQGFYHSMQFDEQIDPVDDFVSVSHGIDVVVDRASVRYLDGTTVDWLDDEEGIGFQFDNPNLVQDEE